uniref:Uncharacterized protein n=1 Tax=Populus alba TaxID=43335 RepID=A0A4U5R099_POPAL|nr:hypothetical protein D5086_0000021890 [Populus alba]
MSIRGNIFSFCAPQNGINSQLLFQDDPLRFNCTGPPPQQQQQRRVGSQKLGNSPIFPRNVYQREPQGTSGDDTDGEDDEDDEEDDEEEVDDVDGGDGISGEMVKDGIGGGGGLGQTGNNAVTIAEADGEMYYSQYLQGTGGSVLVERIWVWKMAVDFLEGRRFQHFSSESGDSLRAILSAPVTGALMDDAMILPCGHSFGAGGMQHVIRMLSDMLSRHFSGRRGVYNLSLIQKGSERGLTRTKVVMAIQGSWIHSQGRGVQFPFAVTDRVYYKVFSKAPVFPLRFGALPQVNSILDGRGCSFLSLRR